MSNYIIMCVIWKSWERERERETHTHTHTERNRETETETDRQRQRDRNRDRDRDRETDTETETETQGEGGRHRERQRETETERRPVSRAYIWLHRLFGGVFALQGFPESWEGFFLVCDQVGQSSFCLWQGTQPVISRCHRPISIS